MSKLAYLLLVVVMLNVPCGQHALADDLQSIVEPEASIGAADEVEFASRAVREPDAPPRMPQGLRNLLEGTPPPNMSLNPPPEWAPHVLVVTGPLAGMLAPSLGNLAGATEINIEVARVSTAVAMRITCKSKQAENLDRFELTDRQKENLFSAPKLIATGTRLDQAILDACRSAGIKLARFELGTAGDLVQIMTNQDLPAWLTPRLLVFGLAREPFDSDWLASGQFGFHRNGYYADDCAKADPCGQEHRYVEQDEYVISDAFGKATSYLRQSSALFNHAVADAEDAGWRQVEKELEGDGLKAADPHNRLGTAFDSALAMIQGRFHPRVRVIAPGSGSALISELCDADPQLSAILRRYGQTIDAVDENYPIRAVGLDYSAAEYFELLLKSSRDDAEAFAAFWRIATYVDDVCASSLEDPDAPQLQGMTDEALAWDRKSMGHELAGIIEKRKRNPRGIDLIAIPLGWQSVLFGDKAPAVVEFAEAISDMQSRGEMRPLPPPAGSPDPFTSKVYVYATLADLLDAGVRKALSVLLRDNIEVPFVRDIWWTRGNLRLPHKFAQ